MKGYISIPEASEKWGISERLVNQYCIEGRVEGAERFGRSWAIPDNAQKPKDPRRTASEKTVKNDTAEGKGSLRRIPMPLMNTPFAPGKCLEAVEKIEDPEVKKLALAEYHYFSGRADEASREAEAFLNSDDLALKLSACWIYGYANLALDRVDKSRVALAKVHEVVDKVNDSSPPYIRALAGSISMAAAVLLHLPLPEGLPDMRECLRLLPPGLKFFALYVRAHHLYLNREYEASLGIVETALSLQPKLYPIPTIYLNLIATMNYMSLKMPEEAKAHMLAAWEIARPDDLIEAFGEHHGLLGGMLESAIKKDWPEDFKRIIAITYSFSAGWREIHNAETGREVADNLTTTEFAAAMLAARDWTNKEIAAHMGLSTETVKHYISIALQKLNISQRKELKQYMLY